ncbi:uncharacterized protein LOC127584378 [Pristis pectinata]|uniref:uncharacterized protein LOC127584378 n=1 Tax=Pristis pectinata TaxID=685728 RepID=UPI00223E85BF|nr:uncharacterized protein LOC127584378 [Pristis pectinata]
MVGASGRGRLSRGSRATCRCLWPGAAARPVSAALAPGEQQRRAAGNLRACASRWLSAGKAKPLQSLQTCNGAAQDCNLQCNSGQCSVAESGSVQQLRGDTGSSAGDPPGLPEGSAPVPHPQYLRVPELVHWFVPRPVPGPQLHFRFSRSESVECGRRGECPPRPPRPPRPLPSPPLPSPGGGAPPSPSRSAAGGTEAEPAAGSHGRRQSRQPVPRSRSERSGSEPGPGTEPSAMLRTLGLAALLLTAELYIISAEGNGTGTLLSTTGSQNVSEENPLFNLNTSSAASIDLFRNESSEPSTTTAALTTKLSSPFSVTTIKSTTGSLSKSTPLPMTTSAGQSTDVTSTSQTPSSVTAIFDVTTAESDSSSVMNGSTSLTTESAHTSTEWVGSYTTVWQSPTSVQSTHGRTNSTNTTTSNLTGSMHVSTSQPRTDHTRVPPPTTSAQITVSYSTSTSQATPSLTSSSITSVSQSTSASTQSTGDVSTSLTTITTAQSTGTSEQQSPTTVNQSTKATQAPNATSTVNQTEGSTSASETTATTSGVTSTTATVATSASPSTVTAQVLHQPSLVIPSTTAKSTTLSTQQTHRKIQQTAGGLSTGSIVAISFMIIVVMLVLIGGVMYFKLRSSPYGRLLDDQESGSWENYNNPLYDDS